MSDFTQIIQEINTNLPDNTTQAITAKDLRDTLIDLTEAIEDQQDNYEYEVNQAIEGKQDANVVEYAYSNIEASSVVNGFIAALRIYEDDTWRTSFFPVEENKKYKITGRYGYGYGSRLYAWFSGDTLVQSFLPPTDIDLSNIKEAWVTVPPNQNITHVAVEWKGTTPMAQCEEKTDTPIKEYNIEELLEQYGEQFEEKQDKIAKIYAYEDIEASSVVNGYIAGTRIVDDGTWRTSFFPVETGTKCKVTGKYGSGYGSKLYAFYNNGQFIASYKAPSASDLNSVRTLLIAIPEDVTHVAVEWKGTEALARCEQETDEVERSFYVAEQINENCEAIEYLSDNKLDNETSWLSDFTPIKYSTVMNGYISGRFVPDNNWRTSLYPVTEGRTYRVTGKYGSGTGSYLYGYFSNGTLVDKFQQATSETTNTVQTAVTTIPAGRNITHIGVEWHATSPLAQCEEAYTEVGEIEDIAVSNEKYLSERKTFTMLCLGNSFTQDTMSYVPYLLQEAEPNCDFRIYFVYFPGATIAQYQAYTQDTTVTMTGPSGDNISIVYANDGGKCTVTTNGGTPETNNYILYKSIGGSKWSSESQIAFKDVITKEKWDFITIQQGGNYNFRDYDYYFKPFVAQLSYTITGRLGYSCKLGYIMTHASYSGTASTLDSRYAGLVTNAQKILNGSAIEIILPYATAVQNARTTFLDKYGTNGHLSNDNIHLVDGIGCLTAAYANTMAILAMISSDRTVVGSQIVPDQDFIVTKNIPGRTTSVGLSKYNIELAQQCALVAYKYPFEETDIEAKGLSSKYEVLMNGYSYDYTNPICSVAEGGTFTTKLTPWTGFSISSVTVTMGGAEVPSAYDATTQTVTVANVTGDVTVNVTTQTV